MARFNVTLAAADVVARHADAAAVVVADAATAAAAA